MTEAKIIADDASEPLPSVVRKPSRPRPGTSTTRPAAERPRPGMEKAIERLLVAAMRGETGHVVDRWQVTSLSELRDAIDTATRMVTDAGGADIGVGPIDVVLAHFPRGDGKPYRVSFNKPVGSDDDA